MAFLYIMIYFINLTIQIYYFPINIINLIILPVIVNAHE